jgi:hypothetical protein
MFWVWAEWQALLADWQNPGQNGRACFSAFELQNNGSVLPSILQTCLSRHTGRLELDNPKTHTAAALPRHRPA